jgi:hypothetical protein
MKLEFVLILLSTLACTAQARMPSKAVVTSCLAAQENSAAITWRPLPTHKIYSTDNYIDGFNAVYYIQSAGKVIGYAEQGKIKAILYDDQLFPITRARALSGFDTPPTELNPFVAEWSTVTDHSGSYLCISFPYGDLGQSGRFQKNRSAYLIATEKTKTQRVLYSATGNVDAP